jgi:hypothetical protein
MVWSRRGRCSAPLRIFERGDNYAGAGGRNQVLPRCQEAHGAGFLPRYDVGPSGGAGRCPRQGGRSRSAM